MDEGGGRPSAKTREGSRRPPNAEKMGTLSLRRRLEPVALALAAVSKDVAKEWIWRDFLTKLVNAAAWRPEVLNGRESS